MYSYALTLDVDRETVHRYRDEVLEVLADQASDLEQTLEAAKAAGCAYLILDGTLISDIDRSAGRDEGFEEGP